MILSTVQKHEIHSVIVHPFSEKKTEKPSDQIYTLDKALPLNSSKSFAFYI